MTRDFLSVVCVAFPGGMRCRPYNYGEAFLGQSRPYNCGAARGVPPALPGAGRSHRANCGEAA